MHTLSLISLATVPSLLPSRELSLLRLGTNASDPQFFSRPLSLRAPRERRTEILSILDCRSVGLRIDTLIVLMRARFESLGTDGDESRRMDGQGRG
jgi:hypothetical protein